mgnify:CR=1 FL=1
MSFTKLDYCQSLLSSPVNYTVTNLADHLDGISHDRINRYLRGEELTPRLLWENAQPSLKPDLKPIWSSTIRYWTNALPAPLS